MKTFNVDYVRRRLGGQLEDVSVLQTGLKSFCVDFRASPRQYYRSAIHVECNDRCKIDSELVTRRGIAPTFKSFDCKGEARFFKYLNYTKIECSVDVDYHGFEEAISRIENTVKTILKAVRGNAGEV